VQPRAGVPHGDVADLLRVEEEKLIQCWDLRRCGWNKGYASGNWLASSLAASAVAWNAGLDDWWCRMSDPQTGLTAEVHPQRKEIARYLLSRGLDPVTAELAPERVLVELGTDHTIEFPAGLTPTPRPIDPAPLPDDPLPGADVVVITWTVDELAGLAHVLTPKVSRTGGTGTREGSTNTGPGSDRTHRRRTLDSSAATCPPRSVPRGCCA
jgi:hypothetical protein